MSGVEILDEAEVARRMRLLAALQETLKQRQIQGILARNQRLVLRYNGGPHEPSGLTDPKLHVFGPQKHVVTIKDSAYVLDGGKQFNSPAIVAATIATAPSAVTGLPATGSYGDAPWPRGQQEQPPTSTD